ncbi:MAG: glycine cleavage system protein H [Candidatus Thermoplasmatota archaeon]|jgi:glycine cleavage system H protein|nr:glycine cleavage system protein H [Candidatus Thermoplasmatota archaeon]MDP7266154.1 glycine cleavage system protein H [Candidatus Thermoplasmatota archaeon]
MKIDEFNFPDDLYYHKEHCWARVEDGLVLIGITDFAQKMAGTIKRVITLEEEDEVSQNKPLGTISSGKWTGKIYSPVSGEIEEVNEDVEDEPGLINEDSYGEGWILKISPEDLDDELGNLMKTGPAFENWMKKEIAEKKALL